MEFLIDYGMFLAKAITIVLSIGVVAGLIASAGQKNKKGESEDSPFHSIYAFDYPSN